MGFFDGEYEDGNIEFLLNIGAYMTSDRRSFTSSRVLREQGSEQNSWS
jgi:hypothetical protein